MQNLVPDEYFDAFTRPIINNKFEEKTCGDGPQLSAMFDDDRHLQKIIHNIRVSSVQQLLDAIAFFQICLKIMHSKLMVINSQ